MTALTLYILIFFVFLFGLCIGSFLNVCIHRIPRNQSIVWPGSRCPYCLKAIRWYDNIPVLSYLLLRGRCRFCKADIAPRYALVELTTGILFVLCALAHGYSLLTPIYWLLISGLVAAAFIDIEFMIIPDRISLGGAAAGLLLSALVPMMHDDQSLILMSPVRSLRAAAFGAILGAGLLWIVGVVGRAILKREAMGLGDVKLMAAVGAFLGWPGVVFTIFVSSVVGMLFGVTMILVGKSEWQSRIPYGPYLAAAAILWMIGGEQWWQLYIGWVQGASF